MTATTRLRMTALVVVGVMASSVAQLVTPAAHADVASSLVQYPAPSLENNRGGITTGPDGNIWSIGVGNINVMSPAGGTVTQYPAAGAAGTITTGSDGNLWFTATQKIGRVTPAGVVTFFTPPAGFSGYRFLSIAAGPDGNLWFIYSRGVGGTHPIFARITTAGVVTTYSPAVNASLAMQIVAGAGGRMWWVDRNMARISSFDPTNPLGTLTNYTNSLYPDVSGPFSGMNSLAAGSDGSIWYSQSGSYEAVNRLTPAGALTIYPVRASLLTVNSVALGPDGAIWFSGSAPDGSSQMARMTPDGTPEYFPMPQSIGTVAMAAGPDGNLWFANGTSSLARVTPPPASSSVLNLVTGFSGATFRQAGPGTTVTFVFGAPNPATATDATGLGLFDSGSQSATSTFPYTYTAAGTYSVVDTLQPSHTATIEVPPTASTTSTFTGAYGGGIYRITWASAAPPAGFAYDVQRQAPGEAFTDFLPLTTTTTTLDRPYQPAGTYAYRARLHRLSDDATSGWSPEVRVRYGSGTPAMFGGYATQASVYRPGDATWYIKGSSNMTYGSPSDVPVPADYDGDGLVDVAVFRPSTGLWVIHQSSDSADVFTTYGVSTDLPVPADYDGDGKEDLAIFRPQFGTWWVHRSSTGADVATTFGGLPGDVPVPGGDFDADGKADLGIYRNGTWFVHLSRDATDMTVTFGIAGDVPVPGFYDGDTKTDVAVYRPAEGVFYVHNSGGGTGTASGYFDTNDVPVPGDYDADGRTDIGVFRPSTGTWLVHRSGGGPDAVLQWGAPGDVPLPLPAALRMTFYP